MNKEANIRENFEIEKIGFGFKNFQATYRQFPTTFSYFYPLSLPLSIKS
jgi:hypothetical protein